MVGYRRKRLRVGLAAGILAFCAGWAVVALLAPEKPFDAPRWQNTLWIYLGANLVLLATNRGTLVGQETIQPVEIAELPESVYLLPMVAVGIASAYLCHEIRTTRVKHNVSNAMAAGTGYFLTALVAMVISDVRPTITVILVIALVLGAGLWIGSTLIGALGRGIPFFGIASLGTVLSVGVLVLLGGLAVFSIVQGLIAVTFIPSIAVGAGFGVSRQLERRGRRSEYPRLAGLREIIEESWKELVVVAVILLALGIGLTGSL